ncbi:MAG: phosphodiester glycosidase family protein [Actinomycetota bacterium]|nr:phosphodiester glycosidase family protein [Actinomycetota bacterium]
MALHSPLPLPSPAPRRRDACLRLRLADGCATTLHVASYAPERVRLRVAALAGPSRLVRWCSDQAVGDAIVGGFFVRPGGTPLGELWIGGGRRTSAGFDAPWDGLRACIAIDDGAIRIARRCDLPDARGPLGDLLQAGPLLVDHGVNVVAPGDDPEGFSAGARQFDSDITAGRYPRAALGIGRGRLIAVACDGRGSEDAGLSLSELADALIGLGAREAINLDGGGSTSLVSDGRLRNHPREEHGVELLGGREISTALVFEPV